MARSVSQAITTRLVPTILCGSRRDYWPVRVKPRGKHSSGRFDLIDGHRRRWKRGTRGPLDMKHQARFYVFAALLLVSLLFEGVELVAEPPAWERVAGIAL